jgi:cell division protein ZapA (FtsZ GTPase activity inhibitor)
MASKVPSENVNVAIYGSTYTLRGGTDAEAVRSLAVEVDARMRSWRRQARPPTR